MRSITASRAEAVILIGPPSRPVCCCRVTSRQRSGRLFFSQKMQAEKVFQHRGKVARATITEHAPESPPGEKRRRILGLSSPCSPRSAYRLDRSSLAKVNIASGLPLQGKAQSVQWEGSAGLPI